MLEGGKKKKRKKKPARGQTYAKTLQLKTSTSPNEKNPLQLDPTTNSRAGAYNETTRAMSAKKGNKPYATGRRALGRHDGDRDPSCDQVTRITVPRVMGEVVAAEQGLCGGYVR